MTDRAIAILRGLAVVGEPRPLTRPAVQARSRAEVEIIEVPSLAAMPAAPPAIDPAELARLRDAAFREGLEQGRAKGFEEGRQQGFKQGLGEGQQEGEAAVRAAARAGQERLDFLTERLEQWLALLPDHFQEQLSQRLKGAEDDMVALCHAVICRFLGDKALGREALAHAVRSAVAAELAGPTGSIHVEPLGMADEVKRLLAAAGSVERFAADLPDRWIDQLVIAGDLAHCADRIASLADQGVDHVILGFPAGITPDRQDTVSRQLIAALAGPLS